MPRLFSLTIGAVLAAVAVMFCSGLRRRSSRQTLDSSRNSPSTPALRVASNVTENFTSSGPPPATGWPCSPTPPAFARTNLTPQTKDLVIGKYRYRADIDPKAGWVLETDPKGKRKKYPILHALGGKNVYYFLTPLERGRLQTLPVAYDVRTRQWFDTAASGVRHFGSGPPEAPVHWKEWPYTFNTACFNCHVSQFSSNYDLATDTYRTTWAEPGINCETCHGPSKEHNEVMQAAPKGQVPADLKIISVKKFTHEQHNAACGSCHAKDVPAHHGFSARGPVLRPL